MINLKTAIYIRVSTEEQAKEGYSIPGQLKKLKAFCISQGWEVEEVYADEGISAKDMERPDLKRMLKDIEEGKIECVLVYRLDRLTRSVLDLYKMLEIFEEHDCKFKSATEVYDTTSAMGRLFITLVAAMAQWERENMGERISFGYKEKVRQGKYPLSFAPIGYDLNKEEEKLYINEEEAKTVRLIFDLYQNKGGNRVARHLNERQIYTKSGNEWTDNTIMKIVNNHVYYGAIHWLDLLIENTHEPIISKEYWHDTQKVIAKRRTQSPRSATSDYIFSGKLRCNTCGGSMSGYYTTSKLVSGEIKKYPQYRCKNKTNGLCKKPKSVSETKLEKAFVELLNNDDYSSFLNEAAATSEKEVNKKVEKVDVSKLKKDLNKIEKQKKKWQYAWVEDIITEEDFKKRMEETKAIEDEIKEKLSLVDSPEKEDISNNEIITLLSDVSKSWSFLDNKEKKNLVDSFVKQIHES